MAMFLQCMLSLFLAQATQASTDIFSRLSTTTRYIDSVTMAGGIVETLHDIPHGCVPIHVNLVARHGARNPTERRMHDIDALAAELRMTMSQVDTKEGDVSLTPGALKPRPFDWLSEFESPWKGKHKGGELVEGGEEEMFQLGQRLRRRLPQLFVDEYHPETYTIQATQVPRASASAVAFGMGLFQDQGTLGPARHRAFAVTMQSKGTDLHLRFHDVCMSYKSAKKVVKARIEDLLYPFHVKLGSDLSSRHGLNISSSNVGVLWILCKYQAALFRQVEEACAFFTSEEQHLLEWLDDVEMFWLKGYGSPLNYQMGILLLRDVLAAIESAVTSTRLHNKQGEKARLRFAHAETVIPFICLLGLFQPDAQKDSLQEAPAMPPLPREWKGSQVAPFAANTALVLFSCGNSSELRDEDFRVLLLHNERPLVIPACGELYCPLHVFKAKVVQPHVHHDFEELCTTSSISSATDSPAQGLPEASSILKHALIAVNWVWMHLKTCVISLVPGIMSNRDVSKDGPTEL